MKQDISHDLLKRYARGLCSDDETARVERWLEEQEYESRGGADMADVSESELWKGLQEKIGSPLASRSRISARWGRWTVAASLVILLAAGGIWSRVDSIAPKTAFTEASAQADSVFTAAVVVEHVLPDKSTVTLAPGATISYPVDFVQNERRVKIQKGEAFFDVRHLDGKPFFVVAENAEIEVLGTRFNVLHEPASEVISVALAEGKVRFHGRTEDGRASGMRYNMLPGQRLEFNRKKGEVTDFRQVDLAQEIGWVEGKLIFEETPLGEVLARIERYYGVTFEIAEGVDLVQKLNGKFEQKPLEHVLSMVEFSTGIKMKKQQKVIRVMN